MRAGRFRFKIIGMMAAVAFAALVLASIVEIRRIRRNQSFYRQEAARYARLEKDENSRQSVLAASALEMKQMAGHKPTPLVAYDGEGTFFPSLDAAPLLAEARLRRYYQFLELAEKFYDASEKTRIVAERYSKAKQRYQRAANCLWLPFAPDPLRGK